MASTRADPEPNTGPSNGPDVGPDVGPGIGPDIRPEVGHGANRGAGRRGGSWEQGPVGGATTTGVACAACAAEVGRAVEVGGIRTAVTSPERAAEVLAPVLVGRDRERCAAALLDTRHRVLDVHVVSIGSLDHTFMAPREIYRDALVANAAAVVVAHNHPSGDPTPSRDDIAVTTRLARAGEVVGVDLLDHLVVAGAQWQSLARAGHV